MFRSPLRRFLSPKILPAASISRLCAARIPAQPLRPFPPPNCILFPLVSTRSFSESHEALAKSKNHFTKDHYDNLAESTLDGILLSLEALAEQREDVDVEYSAGVLTITMPQGTYVINKQPPNRQLWLSSPVSGPFRYNWDHMRMLWVSAKEDGETLSGLLRKEIGIEYDINIPMS